MLWSTLVVFHNTKEKMRTCRVIGALPPPRIDVVGSVNHAAAHVRGASYPEKRHHPGQREDLVAAAGLGTGA